MSQSQPDSHARARAEVARSLEITVGEVRILEIQHRQVGPVAKYILDGQPGIHHHRLDGDES